MSVARLQESIRRLKTPVALVLDPREDRLDGKYLKNFVDMYGDCPMAHAEALRFHGSQAISQAAGKLPAVILRAEPYLNQGFMGMDVLANLVNMAKNQGLYTIVDARCAGTEPWLRGGVNADAVTVLPYGGAECCNAGEDKLVIAVLRTRDAGAGSVQNLVAGDRQVFLAAGEQASRFGAACMAETGFSLDIKELRRRLKGTFLILGCCDGDNAYPAFDEYGHGAMVADEELQYAPDMGAAIDAAVQSMKKIIPVV